MPRRAVDTYPRLCHPKILVSLVKKLLRRSKYPWSTTSRRKPRLNLARVSVWAVKEGADGMREWRRHADACRRFLNAKEGWRRMARLRRRRRWPACLPACRADGDFTQINPFLSIVNWPSSSPRETQRTLRRTYARYHFPKNAENAKVKKLCGARRERGFLRHF